MLHRTKGLSCLFAGVFSAALNAAPAWALQDLRDERPPWIVEEIPGNPVGYCHMKFPAVEEKTLGTDEPRLQRPAPGNMIDFYGPCDHDPLSAEEIQKQIQERQLEDSRPGADD